MHVGAHCHLSWAPFRTPALVRPSFHLPPTLGCAPLHSHTLPLACTWGRTIALSHPCFGVPTLLFMCGSPIWVAPHLAHLPFAHVPPVLLCPQHAHKRRGRVGGAACVNWGVAMG